MLQNITTFRINFQVDNFVSPRWANIHDSYRKSQFVRLQYDSISTKNGQRRTENQNSIRVDDASDDFLDSRTRDVVSKENDVRFQIASAFRARRKIEILNVLLGYFNVTVRSHWPFVFQFLVQFICFHSQVLVERLQNLLEIVSWNRIIARIVFLAMSNADHIVSIAMQLGDFLTARFRVQVVNILCDNVTQSRFTFHHCQFVMRGVWFNIRKLRPSQEVSGPISFPSLLIFDKVWMLNRFMVRSLIESNTFWSVVGNSRFGANPSP